MIPRHKVLLTALVLLSLTGRTSAQPLTVTTLAGQTGGAIDGPGDVALFHSPRDLATDGDNVYVADGQNYTIRKVSPAGLVSTFAGIGYAHGAQDGTGSEARFNTPSSIARDSSGNLYVTDANNYTVRKITPAGVVTTLAGLAHAQGSVDGTGADARFFLMQGIAADHLGNVYVSDYDHTIRKITAAGVVTTLAGLAGAPGNATGIGNAARFAFPDGIDVDAGGNIYVADTVNHVIRKITPEGEVTTFAGAPGVPGSANGTREEARFYYPGDLAFDDDGNLYVATAYTIRKITPAGDVSTLAGEFQSSGYVDANGSSARFVQPQGMEIDSEGDLYVVDANMVRKVTPDGSVSTVAGRPGGTGFTDGTGTAARFNWPYGVTVDGDGNVFVADRVNSNVRKITPAGEVSTFAGPSSGFVSIFKNPRGVAVDGDGFVYLADTDNHTIRKISSAGTVTTLAGLALSPGSTDANGETARFNFPAGIAYRDGVLYVADMNNHTIRKVLANGDVTTLAGLPLTPGTANGSGSAARFRAPEGIAVDGDGNVYVADTANHAIRKITPEGVVTTLAGLPGGNGGSSDGSGTAARFNQPKGISLDAAGNLYIGDSGNRTIRMITSDGLVTTVAGLANQSGTADGTGTAARFFTLAGVAVGSDARVYIADMANYRIRVGVPALPDVATIDVSDGPLFVPRQLDTEPQTATEWTWNVLRRPAGSVNDPSTSTIRNPTFVPDAPGLFTIQLVASDASASSITTVDLTVAAPVDLGPPEGFSATAVGTTQVALSWTPVSGATHYEIFRGTAGGAFVLHDSCPDATCTDLLVQPNTTYLYKVRAVDGGGPYAFSAVDAATTTAFTDHPLSSGTRAKALHLLELRVAVNAMRAAAGLPAATFAASVASGTSIRASAIEELRAAVDPARAALGLPAVTHVDPTLTPQATPVKAAHVAQLREAVQ